MLTICLQNLLSNACKYTMKTDTPCISFGATIKNGETVYFVRDNGAGFDMAFANKLFQPFSRLHNDSEFEGNGIGLATVQKVIAKHGGKIWGEAKPGEGATFYFTLGA
jgi:light-regulated signal transduction histidine kinase (bacteriophytochrome)